MVQRRAASRGEGADHGGGVEGLEQGQTEAVVGVEGTVDGLERGGQV